MTRFDKDAALQINNQLTRPSRLGRRFELELCYQHTTYLNSNVPVTHTRETPMQIRPTTNLQNTAAVNLQPQSKTATTQNPTSMPVDQLNISAEAQLMSAQATTGEIRSDRVAELRAQIASGQYETSEKLDVAIGRLLNEIG
ncbi:MAG: flagellar biosynthesis anti-sigma factor FlgM [Planctomycetota bacterium]